MANNDGVVHWNDETPIREHVVTEGTAAGEGVPHVLIKVIAISVDNYQVVGLLFLRHDKGSCKRPRARDIRENSNIYIIFNKINFLLKNSFFHFLFTTCKIF